MIKVLNTEKFHYHSNFLFKIHFYTSTFSFNPHRPYNFQKFNFDLKIYFSYFLVFEFDRGKRKSSCFDNERESHQMLSILGIKKVDFCVDKFYLTIKFWWWLFWISIFSKKINWRWERKFSLIWFRVVGALWFF